MPKRTRFIALSIILAAAALLAGCSLLPEIAPAEVLPIPNTQAMHSTDGSEAQGQELLQQRLALVAVQRSEAFKSISDSVRNLQTPVIELVDTSVGTFAVVVFNLELTSVEQLRQFTPGITAYPYAMFHVDLHTREVVGAKRAQQFLETVQVRVLDLLTDEQATLDIPQDVLDRLRESRRSLTEGTTDLIRVEPKYICDGSIDEPYEYCYDVEVCTPGHFLQPQYDACLMCCPLPTDPWFGAYILGCTITCWVREQCETVEECIWVFPCDW